MARRDDSAMVMRFKKAGVILPVTRLIPELQTFVQSLLGKGFGLIVIVNGCSDAYAPQGSALVRLFQDTASCEIISIDDYYGRGTALKSGFRHILTAHPEIDNVITVDADSRPGIDDILAVADALLQNPESLVLGVRDLEPPFLPRRKYIRNKVISKIFQLLYGYYISDTRTGLRGIPVNALEWMAGIHGKRRDYEINMLIKARQKNLLFQTIHISPGQPLGSFPANRSIRDTLLLLYRLLSGFIRYFSASFVASAVDLPIFFILNTWLLSALSDAPRILASTAIARCFSATCNFLLNRKFSFAHTGNPFLALVRYVSVITVMMLSSYGMVFGISRIVPVNESIIKLFVDMFLGFFNYQIQLYWVFGKRGRQKGPAKGTA